VTFVDGTSAVDWGNWGKDAPAEPQRLEVVAPVEDRFPRLNWREAFATDFSQIDYLLGKLMERGQQVSFVGDGKAGKSLFMLEWLFRATKGLSFLGDHGRKPLGKVLYFDRENSLRDIVTRLRALGATDDDLDLLMDRFDYRLFPRFSGSLDASQGAALEFLGIVNEVGPDLVTMDTVSRFIGGNENDSNTWLDFYRRIHAPLKANGIACVRLDHYGKDQSKGSRGSSAKTQDVDHVWELSVQASNTFPEQATGTELIVTHLKLNRTYTRTGIGEDNFLITRRGRRVKGGMWVDGSTRHALTANEKPDPAEKPTEGTAQWLVLQLDTHKVDFDWGSPKVIKWCAENGIRIGKTKVEEAVRLRKNLPRDLPYPSVTEPPLDDGGTP
jgi:hypothetical protein